MQSKFNDYCYIVDVFVPDEAPPEHGFPVILVLDGTRYSKLMNETLANQLRNRAKTGVEPAIIVGIGHQEQDIPQQRFYDFTAPAPFYHYPVRRGKAMEEMRAGGAVQLMDFLVQQIIPMLHEHYAVNEKKIALYGHSLGGLFVLWSYLTYPAIFYKYAALSPSIWWNDHELFTRMKQSENHFTAPLYIAVGGEEGDMVTDAEKFHQMIGAKTAESNFYIADEENHASVIPATVSRVLRFLHA